MLRFSERLAHTKRSGLDKSANAISQIVAIMQRRFNEEELALIASNDDSPSEQRRVRTEAKRSNGESTELIDQTRVRSAFA